MRLQGDPQVVWKKWTSTGPVRGELWEVFLFSKLLSFVLIGLMLWVTRALKGRAQVAVWQSHWRLNLLQGESWALSGPFSTGTCHLFYAIESLRIRKVASIACGVSLWEVTDVVWQLCNTFPRFFSLGWVWSLLQHCSTGAESHLLAYELPCYFIAFNILGEAAQLGSWEEIPEKVSRHFSGNSRYGWYGSWWYGSWAQRVTEEQEIFQKVPHSHGF